MPQEATPQHDPYGRVVGYKGAMHGKKFKTEEELERDKIEADIAKEQGATGIAGAAKRSKKEFKDAVEKAYQDWLAKKKGRTAADAAQAVGEKQPPPLK